MVTEKAMELGQAIVESAEFKDCLLYTSDAADD